MPLTSSTDKRRQYVRPGHLYVVATPIGNRDDITLRALGVLKEVDLVAAEDTRHTAKLFSLHGITNRLISCYEHNEKDRIPGLIAKLKEGRSIALVSNAGTPTISDPGYHLVKKAVEEVGAENFNSDVLYNAAVSWSYEYEGIPDFSNFTKTKRISQNYYAVYEIDADQQDIFRAHDEWIPQITSP